MHGDFSARRPAKHLTLDHGDDQHGPVRHPAESRRLIIKLNLRAHISTQRDRFHRVGKKVAEPQAAVAPAWSLAEVNALAQNARCPSHDSPWSHEGSTLCRPALQSL